MKKNYLYEATLIKVIDGDTIDLSVDLGFDVHINTRVRLIGVDTPELRTKDAEEKKRGIQAKTFVEENFTSNGNKCLIETFKKEKYGRYLAKVIFPFGCLNDALVENNLLK